MTITEFLQARIDEEEADAQDALERGFGGWEWLADAGINYEARTHIVRWHPARVLREITARRRTLELHQPAPLARTAGDDSLRCTECGYTPDRLATSWPCPTLLALLPAYSDHSDFDPRWLLQ